MLYGIRAHEQPTSTPRGQVKGRDARCVFPPREYCGAVLYLANDVGLVLCCGSASYLEEPHQSPYLHVLHAGLPGFGASMSVRQLKCSTSCPGRTLTRVTFPPLPPQATAAACATASPCATPATVVFVSVFCFCSCFCICYHFFRCVYYQLLLLLFIIATKETDAIM